MNKYFSIGIILILFIVGFGAYEQFRWLKKYNCSNFELAINNNFIGQDFYFYKKEAGIFQNWQKLENLNYFRLTLDNHIEDIKFSKLGEISDLEIKNCLIQNNAW